MAEKGDDYSAYANEENLLQEAVANIKAVVAELGPILEIDRTLLPSISFLKDDILIAIGQDGLVANTLRYSGALPIFGVNPDTSSYEGTLLHFSVESIIPYLKSPSAYPEHEEITLAEGELSTGAKIRAANDIFMGKGDHSSALYRITHKGQEEHHSSSGVIISTPMGATGWQRSIIEGSLRILSTVTGQSQKSVKPPPLTKADDNLRFWVREPWPSVKSQSHLVAGKVTEKSPLKITSEMGENGLIFADGMQNDAFPFPAGETLTLRPSKTKGRLVLP
jgi:hypothetical protein